jgi:hypothetical protein
VILGCRIRPLYKGYFCVCGTEVSIKGLTLASQVLLPPLESLCQLLL